MSSDFRILGYSSGGGGGGSTGPTGPTGADGPTGPTGPAGGGGGGVIGTGTATEVAFWTDTDTLSSDSNFYWDNTDKELWIGSSPDSGGEDLTVVGDATMSGHMSLGGNFVPAGSGRTANATRVLYIGENMTANNTRLVELAATFTPSAATDDHTSMRVDLAVAKNTAAFDVVIGSEVIVDSQNNSGGTSLTAQRTELEHSVSGGDIATIILHDLELDLASGSNATFDDFYGINLTFSATPGTSTVTNAYGIYIDDMEDVVLETGHPIWYNNATSGRFMCVTYQGFIGINVDQDSITDGVAHFYQNDSSGSIGVLYLQQEDDEKQFLNLHGYAVSSSVNNSLVAVADVSSTTAAGYARIEIKDEGSQISNGPYYIEFVSLT
jgi:hypothetical protein